MVETVVGFGQPALGLTDHGNMAGAVQLYQECSKAGIKPFPGMELYTVLDRKDKKAKRHHMGVVAFTTEGYKNLVYMATLSNKNFHNKPLLDHNDLAQLAEAGRLRGIAGLSGCRSGFIAEALVNQNPGGAEVFAQAYANWFDRFYVEIMNHGITWDYELEGTDEVGQVTDDEIGDQLLEIAQRLGLPVVITQDSHYCLPADRIDHDNLKKLVSFGPDPDDGVFSGDGYLLADEAHLRAHHREDRFNAGVAGLQDLLEAHDLHISQLDHYAYNIPFTVDDPSRELRDRCSRILRERGLSSVHQARLEEELDVIEATGMAGYLLLVAEVTDWCTDHQVFYQARGSAAGSMCCWLLGITPVDPIKWKLSYERFISRDRTKPPDIDLDVEHTRRQELIDWLATRFNVAQIGNWRELKLSGEVDPDTGETRGKGSLRVQYFARKKQLGEEVGEWSTIPKDEQDTLYRLDSLGIVHGHGKHAAGIILTTTQTELDELVPLMWIASSESFVSQFDMNDIEALGLVKLDVLGLKTLSTLHKAHDNLKRPVDLEWIPMAGNVPEVRQTFQRIASGQTDGVFQLEGWTSRKGVRELKPTTVTDIIAAMALFRPATMDSGATRQFINVKHKRLERVERHPLLDGVTKETNGVLLFQEQVISVLRELGMNPDDLTKFLKAVKASQKDEMVKAKADIAGYELMVGEMAREAGIVDDDWKWLWEAITGFAAYGFNRAHSTVYGITSYRCAYLSANYPIEFHAALLNIAAGGDKEAGYIAATRKRDIRLARPDVEESGISYEVSPSGRSIRKGLTSIKGVGVKGAAAIVVARPAGGFRTLDNFARLVDRNKVNGIKPYLESGDKGVGALGKLIESGAMENLEGV